MHFFTDSEKNFSYCFGNGGIRGASPGAARPITIRATTTPGRMTSQRRGRKMQGKSQDCLRMPADSLSAIR